MICFRSFFSSPVPIYLYMSNKIQITETDLHYLVSESMRRILREGDSEWNNVLAGFVKYLEGIGRYGRLEPEGFNLGEVYRDVGYHSFFMGYASDGELDEDGFYEFLDMFFGKYGEGVLKEGYDIKDIYTSYNPSDLEEALTPEGLDAYLKEIDTRGKEWFESYTEGLTFNSEGQVYCARAIVLNRDFTVEDFAEEFGDGVGIYWSYCDRGAVPYYADGVYGPTVVLRGWVNPGDVNWGESIQAIAADEAELRLEYGATVQVDAVVHEYTDKPLPLKGSILLPA